MSVVLFTPQAAQRSLMLLVAASLPSSGNARLNGDPAAALALKWLVFEETRVATFWLAGFRGLASSRCRLAVGTRCCAANILMPAGGSPGATCSRHD